MPDARNLHRFLLGRECHSGEEAALPTSQSRHLARVLRIGRGERVRVFTPAGREFTAVVLRADPIRTIVEVREPIRSADAIHTCITLAFAPPSPSRADLIVEKATELGAACLQPLICQRSQGFEKTAISGRIDRWRRKTAEAAKQCGRSIPPEVQQAREFPDFVSSLSVGLALIGSVAEGAESLWNALSGLEHPVDGAVIIVGPAGGFTARELSLAEQAGCRSVSLGENVLRVETAAIVLLAAVALRLQTLPSTDEGA